MANNTQQMSPSEWVMLITLSILWGGSFFLVEVALDELPPLTVVALRSTIAAVTLLLFFVLTRRKLPLKLTVIWAFFVMSVLNNVIPFSLIVWGQTQIEGGLASILNATSPLFILVAAHFLTHDEKMTTNKAIGLILGFTGASVIIGVDFLLTMTDNILGQLAVIGASMSYALAGIYGKRFAGMGIRPVALATGQVTFSSLIMIPLALLVEDPLTLAMPSAKVLWSVATLGIVSTVVAYLIYFRILQRAGATNALLVTLLVPVSAILFGYLFLSERLMTNHFIGMAMIMFGLLIIDGRLFKKS